MTDAANPINKIEYHFLRNSAERFASDLKEFADEIKSFSDEQLYGIVGRYEYIEEEMKKVKNELAKRGED